MKALLLIVLVAACGDPPKDSVAKLEDPNTCAECHQQHFTEWSSSMHAYAATDPVFLAMNKRGQRETNGALGTFCLQCHAPMAVALNLVTNDTAAEFDPTTLPAKANGITCYFCHNVKSIQDDHNNGLVLALDDTMRGGVKDPTTSPAHNAAYDTKMDGHTNESQMCGSCHDVVTPAGVHVERSYSEWQGTVFAMNDPTKHLPLTCSGCHMKSDPTTNVIADKPGLTVKSRPDSFHLHTWPAIDQAMVDFPGKDVQLAGIKDILDPALTIIGPRPISGGVPPGGICLDPPGVLTVRMDTISTGHMYPSGAAQDRRSWLEVIAYDAGGNVVFSSGDVPADKDPEEINDPNLYGFWDRTFKSDSTPAHFFWDIATYDSKLLKPAVTNVTSDPLYDHSTTATFNIGATYTNIDKITARIRTRPFNYAALDALVASGDLDASIASEFRQDQYTLESFGGTATWTKATKGTGIGSMNTNCNPNPPLPGM